MITKQRAYNKAHYQKNKDKIKIERDKSENKTKQKAYFKIYNQKPEVIQRKKEQNTPEYKVRMKLARKKHYQKNKDKIKLERDKPKNKAKLKAYLFEYNQRPKVIQRKKEQDTPENKARQKEYMKKHYQKNKEKINEKMKPYIKRWQKENPEYLKEYRQKHKEKIKELCKKAHLKKFYNLSLEDYNEMVKQQNNKCAICGNEETNTHKGNSVNLSLDHNQKTGKVRELLCKDCNVTLGNLKEDISLFYKCIEYLEKHKTKELINITN